MAGQAQIRWNKNSNRRLGRAIDAYNKRIRRLKKRHPNQKLFIGEITRKEAKSVITTKSQLNTFIKQLEMANAKTLTIKDGLTSEYEKYSKRLKRNYALEISAQRENTAEAPSEQELRLREAIKNIDASQTMGRFPTQEDLLKKQIGLKNLNDENYERLLNWLGDEKRARQSNTWKNNYLDLIRAHMEVALAMANEEGYSILKSIYEKVSAMELSAFVIGQLSSSAELGIGEIIISPPSLLQVNSIELDEQNGEYERVLEVWDKYG